MPMLILKCKTCSEVFPGSYVPERSTDNFKLIATKHTNEYDTLLLSSEFYQSYTCNASDDFSLQETRTLKSTSSNTFSFT